MGSVSLFQKLKNMFRPGRATQRVSLEVRPDGIAWAMNVQGPDPRSGFSECLPARRGETLKSLVEQNGWAGAVATLVLPLDQYQVFQMERPEGIEEDELADALKWKLKDLLDFSPSDAVSDVFPFPSDGARGRGELANVVAARKALVSDLAALVLDCGMQLERVDIAELALRNLVARMSGTDRSTALVHLREGYGQLVICRGQTLYLSRRLDVSYDELRDAARQESAVQTLALEIQRSLDYYESQMGQVPPNTIFLVARDSVLPLSSMLSSYVAAEIATPDWASLGLDGSLDSRCIAAWSSALVGGVA